MGKITLLLCFISTMSLVSQEVVMLEGQVLNDTIDRSNLTVVNISLKRGTTTSNSGEFTIEVRENDTIHISAVQYESREFVVNQTIFSRKKISLYLIPKVNELDEVTISNIDLTGDIEKDIKNTKLKPAITAASLGLPENAHPTFTAEERRVYAATTGSGAISSLINAISGRTAMLKKHLEVSKLQAKVYSTRDKFSDLLYMKELNIPEELIEDFVYYVFEDKKAIAQVNQGNLIELLDFMMDKSKTYLLIRKENIKTID